MKKFRISMGAIALVLAAVAIIACSKEKTAQQETTTTRQPAEAKDYTLAEMAEAMSWEEGKAFFENQPIKDYTAVCEKVLNDCGLEEKAAVAFYSIDWQWRITGSNCNPNYNGVCLIIKRKEGSVSNAMGYYEDGKLIIIPTTEDNGFTEDGYLAVGSPIEIQNDSIVVSEGIYSAYYDDEQGRFVAVAVDYERLN